MLFRSLEAELANDNKNLAKTKNNKAADEESKAAAESDLGSALDELKKGEESLASANAECMQVAADHQATITARAEELKVVAKAKQIIEETTNRMNRLSQAESENEVKLFRTQGEIEQEKLNGALLSIKH